ncbi:MAG: N-acetyltransferase family protein [Gemmatimonadales bacterium]
MPHSTEKEVRVRPASHGDAGAIAAIYNHYIANTVVTFEEEPVSEAEVARRMEAIRSVSLPWLVVEQDGQVLGYAYAAPFSPSRAR